MSDVRLSNGSPTLEQRTDQQQQQRVVTGDQPKPSACRSLFGSVVDHEELRRDLKGHLREMEEAASAKWGFDFANHKPLVLSGSGSGGSSSRLEWELVDCRDVPDFYSNSSSSGGGGQVTRRESKQREGVCSAGNNNNNNVDLNGNHSCVVVVTTKTATTTGTTTPPGEGGDGQMECTEQCAGLRKRPACHDTTSAQTKRSHTTTTTSSSSSSDEVSCPSLSRSSAEHTPRKSPKRQT